MWIQVLSWSLIIPKNKHGTEGSKEYSNAYDLAMTALSPKLGAAKHFVTRSEDGEVIQGMPNTASRAIGGKLFQD